MVETMRSMVQSERKSTGSSRGRGQERGQRRGLVASRTGRGFFFFFQEPAWGFCRSLNAHSRTWTVFRLLFDVACGISRTISDRTIPLIVGRENVAVSEGRRACGDGQEEAHHRHRQKKDFYSLQSVQTRHQRLEYCRKRAREECSYALNTG